MVTESGHRCPMDCGTILPANTHSTIVTSMCACTALGVWFGVVHDKLACEMKITMRSVILVSMQGHC